jgi:hypothetical protein
VDIGTETGVTIIEPISEPIPDRQPPPAPEEPEIAVEEETYERDEELVPA